MKVLLFGSGGQLGEAIRSRFMMEAFTLVSAPRTIDICDFVGVTDYVNEVQPQWVINAAAMTNVDAAHEAPDVAMAVNGLGPGFLARAAATIGARLIHVSTEAVFDGEQETPYSELDVCAPVSAYGASKLAGEHLVRIYCPDSYVVRTSWLYSGRDGMNFPTRLLQQLEDPNRLISVVTDVIGNPTPTSVLADAVLALIASPPAPGTYHVCCSEPASKWEWAVEIARSSGFDPARIAKVCSADFPTLAARPKHVDLNCEKFRATGLLELPSWLEAWRALSR